MLMDRHQALLQALRHPLRRKLFKLLIEVREISPSDAAPMVERDVPAVSYHMRSLVDAGAAVLVRTEQARGATEHFYVPSPDVEAIPWVREAIGLPSQAEGLG
jgi:DNA-binding transcriptional ArsR family regulator